jgi:hypothetical protein
MRRSLHSAFSVLVAGSLLSQPNRIVVFEVSGIIDLTAGKEGKPKGGRIEVAQPNITIAGQRSRFKTAR